MAVGAAWWDDTPACGHALALEAFSAKGGDPILFDSSGKRLTTPVTRQKPDIVGPDGVVNTFLGYVTVAGGSGQCSASGKNPDFFGTSAATPHVAAAAALLLQKNPNLLPAGIYQSLQKSALPMGTPSPDFLTGYGFIQANTALTDEPSAPTLTLNLSATTINVGDSSTLTWSATNADTCTASGAWSGTQALSGSLKVTPTSAAMLSYTLTCSNSVGFAKNTDVLTVVTPAGGGGGGGALDLAGLLALAGFAATRLRRRA
jgi:subtilisin family serine protease